MATETEEPRLEIEKHIKYWHRCLKSVLPTQYTSTDSSRMTLGFFILSALDLLNVDARTLPAKDRRDFRNWILKCQHPNGGFCGSPNHRYPDAYYTDVGNGRQQMDPANLPATFFAILSLSYVGSLDGVKRNACLKWLKSLQREDGSFGELITQEGVIEGGRDMRYCHVATMIRWMLRGDVKDGDVPAEEDINVDKLIDHIRAGQTYDGGISESSHHEAHAGYTYCAIAALSMLHRLPNNITSSSEPGLTDIAFTIRWLVSRQQGYREEDDEEASPTEEKVKLAGVYEEEPLVPGLLSTDEDYFVGFNGRCNKRVDTCYAFWVTASLDMLGEEKAKLVNTPAIRRFLFEQTQHIIGGFGKCPGNPPDIYHSYLGLAVLSVMKEPGLKPLNSALCISTSQKERIDQLRKAALVRTRTYSGHGYSFSIREDDPEFATKTASKEGVSNSFGASSG